MVVSPAPWVGEKWWPLLTGRTVHDPTPAEVDRRYFEICLFTQVVNELKSGDLCIPGSEEYGDYRDQLVSWEEYNRDVAGYAERAGVPVDPAAFVTALKARLARTADATDSAFPENEQVEIVDGEPVVKRLRAREAADGTAFLERLLKPRMVPVGVLEALADTEHWLDWTRHFGPVSGFEAKLERPRERYLATVFCYGCGLGPSQAARSLKGLDRRHMAFANQRHVTEETLDDAITGVIDAYARVGLHRHWGSGESASADGMKWDVHPESLKSSYHIRYGGYGGIGYYLVSDTYIALFSRFLACGAYEGHAILDFVTENRSLLQPSTVHSDTHGQSVMWTVKPGILRLMPTSLRAGRCPPLRSVSLFGWGPFLRPGLRHPEASRAAAVKDGRRPPRSGARRASLTTASTALDLGMPGFPALGNVLQCRGLGVEAGALRPDHGWRLMSASSRSIRAAVQRWRSTSRGQPRASASSASASSSVRRSRRREA